MSKAVFYASVGPALTLYTVEVDGLALAKQGSFMLPANITFARTYEVDTGGAMQFWSGMVALG